MAKRDGSWFKIHARFTFSTLIEIKTFCLIEQGNMAMK